jgi:hypothetical protein
MNKQSAAETFDFTASFKMTLDRFDSLSNESRADYTRAREKREQAAASTAVSNDRATE